MIFNHLLFNLLQTKAITRKLKMENRYSPISQLKYGYTVVARDKLC